MISKFKIIGSLIIMLSFNGCTNWGNEAEEKLLAVQSNEIAKRLAPNNILEYRKCFEKYIITNYTAKEWVHGKGAQAKMAMLNCMKYNENFKEGNK